jgi:hypothetical protein
MHHNFHPIEGSNHFSHQLNNQPGNSRHKVGSGSVDNSINNHMGGQSNDISLNMSQTYNGPASPHGHMPQSQGNGHVSLNKKMIGGRKRNNREKSYDSYN